jgi:hypothetical protein
MKKLIYLFLGLLIVACGDDDSSNCDYADPSFMEGVWVAEIQDFSIESEGSGAWWAYGLETVTINNEGLAVCSYEEYPEPDNFPDCPADEEIIIPCDYGYPVVGVVLGDDVWEIETSDSCWFEGALIRRVEIINCNQIKFTENEVVWYLNRE